MINSYCFKGTNSKAPRLQQFSDKQFPIPEHFSNQVTDVCKLLEMHRLDRNLGQIFSFSIERFKAVIKNLSHLSIIFK